MYSNIQKNMQEIGVGEMTEREMPCANGCRYCYANFSPASVRENMAKYDPDSPILCDSITEEEEKNATIVKAKPLIDRQLTLFGV
ncbi:hypothetical protein SAMN02910292_01229 [Lachnospiraceae bacterium XBB2008]|nr:hypothetical protein SAMN02910292_01229 [Lachnospiraceae bacterium XBB2008]